MKKRLLRYGDTILKDHYKQNTFLLSTLYKFYQINSKGKKANKKNWIFSENLQNFFCYIHALNNSLLYNDKIERRVNTIEFCRRRSLLSSSLFIANYFFPKIYDLSYLEQFLKDFDDYGDYESTELIIPPTLPQIRWLLEQDKCYLIDNYDFFIIFVKKKFKKFEEYFGINSNEIKSLKTTCCLDFTFDTLLGRFCNRFVDHLRSIYNGYSPSVMVVLEG